MDRIDVLRRSAEAYRTDAITRRERGDEKTATLCEATARQIDGWVREAELEKSK